MAQQTFTIGAPTRTGTHESSGEQWLRWDPPASPRLIDAGLVVGGGTAYLRVLLLTSGGSSLHERIQVRDTDSGLGEQVGPHLTSEWEQYSGAIVIEAGSLSLTLRGPAATGVSDSDADEPYLWNTDDEQATRAAFITAYGNLTTAQQNATTLTLDDGVPVTQELEVEVDHDGESTFSATLTYKDVPDPLTLDDLNVEDGETVRLGFVIQLDSAINFSDSNQIIYNRRTTETNVGTIVAGDTEIDSAILADGDPTTNIERFRIRTTGGIVGGRVGFNDDSTASLSAINSNYAGILRVVIVTKDISAGTTRRIEETWSDIYAGGGGTFMNMNTLIASSGELWGGSSTSTPLQAGDQILVGWIQLADFELEAEVDHDGQSTFSATLSYEEGEDQEIEAELSTSNTSTFSAALTYEAFVATEQTFTIGAPTSSQNAAGNYILNWAPPDAPRLVEELLVADRSTAYIRQFRIRSSNSERLLDIDSADSDSDLAGPHLTPAWEDNSTALILEAGDLYLVLRGPTASGVGFSDTTEPYVWNVSAESENTEDFFEAYFNLTQAERDATTLTLRDTPAEYRIRAEVDHDGASTFDAELTYHDVPSNEQTLTIGAPSDDTGDQLFWSPPASPRLVDAAFVSGGVTAYLRRFHLYTSGSNEVVELRVSGTDSGSGIDTGPELRPAFEQNTYALTLEAGGLSLTIGGPNSSGVGTADSSEPYAWFYSEGSLDLSDFFTAYDALSQAEKDATTLTLRDSIPDTELEAEVDHDGLSTFSAELTYEAAPDSELEAELTHDGVSTFDVELAYSEGADHELEVTVTHDGVSTFDAELAYQSASDQALEVEVDHDGVSTFSAQITYQAAPDSELEVELDHDGVSTFDTELTYSEPLGYELEASLSHDGTSTFDAVLSYSAASDQELEAELSHDGVSTFDAQLTHRAGEPLELEANVDHDGVSTFSAELTYHEATASLTLAELNAQPGEVVVLGFVFQLEAAIAFTSSNQVLYNRRTGETETGTLIAGDPEVEGSLFADDDPVTDITRVRFRTSGGVFGRRIGFNESTTAELSHINANHADVLRIVVVTKDISAGTTRRAERSWVEAHGGSGSSFVNLDLDISAPEDLWSGSDGTTPLQGGDQVLIGWILTAQELEVSLTHDGVSTFDAQLTYVENDQELEAALTQDGQSTFDAELTYEAPVDFELEVDVDHDGESTFDAQLTYEAGIDQELEAALSHDGVSTFAAELTYHAATALQRLEAELDHTTASTFDATLTYELAVDLEYEATVAHDGLSMFDATLSYQAGIDQELEAELDHNGPSTFAAELTYNASVALTRLEADLSHDGQSTFNVELAYEPAADVELEAALANEGQSTFDVELTYEAGPVSNIEAVLDHDGSSTFNVELTYHASAALTRLEADLSHDGQSTFNATLTYEQPLDLEYEAALANDGQSTFNATLTYGSGLQQELDAELAHNGQSTFDAALTNNAALDQELTADVDQDGQSTFDVELTYETNLAQTLEAVLDTDNASTFDAEITYQPPVDFELAASINRSFSLFDVVLAYETAPDSELAAELSHDGASSFEAELTFNEEVRYTYFSAVFTHNGVSSFNVRVSHRVSRKIRSLTKRLFRTAAKEKIKLRVYEGHVPAREFGTARTVLPAYEERTIEAVIVPLSDSAPGMNHAGRPGRYDLRQEKGGRRPMSTQTFIVPITEIEITRKLFAKKPIKILYGKAIWEVSSVQSFETHSQLVASVEH